MLGDDTLGYMDNDEMDEKEIVLINIENLNDIDLSYYLTNCEQVATAWQEYKKINSREPYFIIENIDGSKKIYIVEGKDEEETEKTKLSYDASISQYEILQNDEDVIRILEKRIRNIEYDENSEKVRAEAVYTISSILRLNLAGQKKQENNWIGIQAEIADILKQMTVRDLLKTLEWSGRQTMIETRIFSDELVKRIPEMTEEEFTRYLSDIQVSGCSIYSNAETAISEKIQSMTPALAQKYLQLIRNQKYVLEIINKAEKNNVDIVEVLLETLDSGRIKVQEKNQELIAKLSEEQVVRLLLMASVKNTSQTCDKLLAQRLGNVSDVMLEALIMAYINTGKSIIMKKLYDICEQRGKMKYDKDGNGVTISIDSIPSAKSRAELFILSSLAMSKTNITVNKRKTPSTLELMQKEGKSYEEEIEKVKADIYEEFKETNMIIEFNEETVKYIKELQLANDATLIKTIVKANIPVQDKEIQGKEEFFSLYGLRTIQEYLNGRILKMSNIENLIKLSYIPLNGGILDEAISERIERFQLEKIKCNQETGENPGSTDARE